MGGQCLVRLEVGRIPACCKACEFAGADDACACGVPRPCACGGRFSSLQERCQGGKLAGWVKVREIGEAIFEQYVSLVGCGNLAECAARPLVVCRLPLFS